MSIETVQNEESMTVVADNQKIFKRLIRDTDFLNITKETINEMKNGDTLVCVCLDESDDIEYINYRVNEVIDIQTYLLFAKFLKIKKVNNDLKLVLLYDDIREIDNTELMFYDGLVLLNGWPLVDMRDLRDFSIEMDLSDTLNTEFLNFHDSPEMKKESERRRFKVEELIGW